MTNDTEELTWKQFVHLVESAGVKPSTVISWIDWSGPAPGVRVETDNQGRVQVTHSRRRELRDVP